MVLTIFGVLLSTSVLLAAPTEGEKTEESYDPLNTMLALNAAIMSVHKVTSTADRIVLDQEYREILTNFAYGNVADDDELINVYNEILDILTREQLQRRDRERFQKAYERQISRVVLVYN